jgi:hypothetical protein
MSINAKEAKELGDLVVEAAPGLGETPLAKLQELLAIVIAETTKTNNGVEERVREAGSIPPDITIVLMHYGALTAIYRDLPSGDSRRALILAGEQVGAFIAKKYGEKLRSELTAKTTTH